MTQKKEETILEYESKNGTYRHKGTYGYQGKGAEHGNTDYEKANDDEKKEAKSNRRKYGARQNYVRSSRVNEFTDILNVYEKGGLKALSEAWAAKKKKVMKEEPDNEQFTKEVEENKKKAAGTAKQAEVAKPAVQAVQNEETVEEELKGNQHKIDKNKNGKIDAHDFKLLRKEETHTEVEVIDVDPINGVQQHTINLEDLEERALTEPEMNKREEVVKSMKKNLSGFKDRYGKDAKSVMYATATKIAKK